MYILIAWTLWWYTYIIKYTINILKSFVYFFHEEIICLYDGLFGKIFMGFQRNLNLNQLIFGLPKMSERQRNKDSLMLSLTTFWAWIFFIVIVHQFDLNTSKKQYSKLPSALQTIENVYSVLSVVSHTRTKSTASWSGARRPWPGLTFYPKSPKS